MQPDDDLKAAFAELHRRRREHAPAFEPMRERALKASESPALTRRSRLLPSLALAGATCAAVLGLWWANQVPQAGEKESGGTAKDEVETLITAIQEHLEVEAPAVAYPTDLLLAGDSTDFNQ